MRVPAKTTIRKFRRLAIPVQVAILVVGVISLSSGVFASVYMLRNPGSPAYTLNDGLLGRWQMNGNANDSVGSNNGSVSGASLTTDRDGNASSAYSFNGTSNQISIPNSGPTYIPSNNAPFSFSIWLYPTTLGGDRALISNESYNNYGFRFMFVGSNLKLWTAESGGNLAYDEITTGSLSTSTWYHIVLTYDGSVFKIYQDGNLVDTSPSGRTIDAGTNSLILAGGIGGKGRFAGKIDDYRIYDREVNATEVSQLYAGLEDPGGDPPTTINTHLAKGYKGMVGHWKMNGNATDGTPYGNNGTINNGASLTTDRMDNPNKAYSFNGSNRFISVTDTSRLQFGTGDFSLSAWVKTSASTDQTIIGKYAGSGTNHYWLGVTDTGLASFGIANTRQEGGSGLNDGNWHLITGARISGVAYLYVDGQLVDSGSQSGQASASGSYFAIGKYGSSGAEYFNGSIDDVRVYNRGLAATEAADLYNTYDATLNLGGDFGTAALGSNLVGRWQMTGNANDATPYSNNGTVSGASLTTDRFGTASSAYSFNGTSNQISIPNPTPTFIPSNNAPFSMSMWLYPTNVSTGYVRAVVSNETYNTSGFRFGINSSAQFDFWTGESGGNLSDGPKSTTTAVINTWYLVTVTYDGSIAKLYVNGNPEDVSASGRTVISNTNNIILAGGIGGADRFAGKIDDFRTWSRALSVQEVQAIYDNN